MTYLIVISTLFQCMLNTLETASSVEIKKDWSYVKVRPSKKKHLEKYLVNTSDARIYAVAHLESRMRPVKPGDDGRACGIFQIHARYSYPLFRRKRGFVGWDEKSSSDKIEKECDKLMDTRYSISTMVKLTAMMDEKGLHLCHHNSGFYGKCDEWYKKRLDFWTSYFEISKLLCDRKVEIKWGL